VIFSEAVHDRNAWQPEDSGRGALGKLSERLGLPSADLIRRSTGCQLPHREGPDRLEHVEAQAARAGSIAGGPRDQAVVGEFEHGVQDTIAVVTAARDTPNLFDVEATIEDRKLLQQPLLVRWQELIAPGDRRFERLLTFGEIPGSAGGNNATRAAASSIPSGNPSSR
jgi:hypothetical protein